METSGSVKISKIHTTFLYVVCWRDSGLWAEKAGEDFSLMAVCKKIFAEEDGRKSDARGEKSPAAASLAIDAGADSCYT